MQAKRWNVAAIFGAFAMSGASFASAALIDRGGGLIYDTDLDLTWLQDTYDFRILTWNEAANWAANLEYYDPIRDQVWDDWRLPRILPIKPPSFDLAYATDGSTDLGFNIRSRNSELAYLYYLSLGNLASTSPSGVRPQPGWSYNGINTGPFSYLGTSYWSESEFVVGEEIAYFNMRNGEQANADASTPIYMSAWAVRVGDVPEPGTGLLIGLGLIRLAWTRPPTAVD